MSVNGPFLYPNVSHPSQVKEIGRDSSKISKNYKKDGPAEFDRALDKAIDQFKSNGPDLNQVKSPLKFSGHAIDRVRDRKIDLNPNLVQKLGGAVDKAAAKGVEDTLILTSDAAFIVNVKNRTVVTAMERNALDQNVFTNIDGAVVVS